MREEEEGRSERHPVMGLIGVEPLRNITPRASALTSVWSCLTRDLGQPLEESKQRTAVATLTGARSDRMTVWRLQARRVKVVPEHVLDVA